MIVFHLENKDTCHPTHTCSGCCRNKLWTSFERPSSVWRSELMRGNPAGMSCTEKHVAHTDRLARTWSGMFECSHFSTGTCSHRKRTVLMGKWMACGLDTSELARIHCTQWGFWHSCRRACTWTSTQLIFPGSLSTECIKMPERRMNRLRKVPVCLRLRILKKSHLKTWCSIEYPFN